MTIKEQYQDIAGKWRTLIDISEVNSAVGGKIIMLKFDYLPTNEEIIYETNRYIENKVQEEVRIFEEQIDAIEAQIAALESQII